MNKRQTSLLETIEEQKFHCSLEEVLAYKNMSDALTITCKNNHTQRASVSDFIGRKWECIDCIAIKEADIKSTTGFLLSLDAATNVTGWAIFNKEGQLLNKGTIEAPKKYSLMERIEVLITGINELINANNIKFIGLEDSQLEYNPQVFKTLSMLRGVIFYEISHKQKMPIYSCGADVWRSYSNIKGSNRAEKKANTILRANKIYKTEFKEDEADAVFLGKYIYSLIPKEEKGE